MLLFRNISFILLSNLQNVKKTEEKSHKKFYEKYSWSLEGLNLGENTSNIQLKGKNPGSYNVKRFYLKISMFRFKLPVPSEIKSKEFAIYVINN